MYDARCAHCGYDLVGLPPEGSCPECGRAFDKKRRGSVADADAGEAGAIGSKRPLAAGLAGLGLLSAGTGGAFALAAEDPLQPLAWGMVIGGALLVAALFVVTR